MNFMTPLLLPSHTAQAHLITPGRAVPDTGVLTNRQNSSELEIDTAKNTLSSCSKAKRMQLWICQIKFVICRNLNEWIYVWVFVCMSERQTEMEKEYFHSGLPQNFHTALVAYDSIHLFCPSCGGGKSNCQQSIPPLESSWRGKQFFASFSFWRQAAGMPSFFLPCSYITLISASILYHLLRRVSCLLSNTPVFFL